MRTKTLLLTAALSAAGIATSMAQVYSVNAVGYVNTTLAPGFNLVSNPLDAANSGGNTIANLFKDITPASQVYKFNGTSYTTAQKNEFDGTFEPADAANTTVVPGEGVFVRLEGTAPVTITFVGEVKQGKDPSPLSNPVPAGFSIRSSQVPQAGKVTTDLGFPAAEGDQVYLYNTTRKAYDTFQYSFGAYDPSEPTVDVGQAFFSRKDVAANWTRSFSVSN